MANHFGDAAFASFAGLGDATVDIDGIGTFNVSNGVMSKDVLYASAGANIISISAATKGIGSIILVANDVLLNGREVGTKVASGLYKHYYPPLKKL